MKMFEKILQTTFNVCYLLMEIYCFYMLMTGLYYGDEDYIYIYGFMLFGFTCIYVFVFIFSITVSLIWSKERKQEDGRESK